MKTVLYTTRFPASPHYNMSMSKDAPVSPGPFQAIALSSSARQLGPALKAALWVSWAIAILEIASSSLPVIGYILTLPLAILVYAIQGTLVGRFTSRDGRFAGASPQAYARQGAISALWTSLGISTAITFMVEGVLAPLTLGSSLAGLPAVLAGSLGDVAINLAATSLLAWIYRRLGSRWSISTSCALAGAMVLAFTCLGLAATALALTVFHSK